ncbi:MAG: DNA polymerase III subunit beta [Planctomycetota bacterium]|jgi:DNA polymerase-3 subunit beta
MKVICDRAALVDAVTTASGIVASRTPTPVLKCLKLTATDPPAGGLILTATDLEVGLRLGVSQVEIERSGEAAVPADKISQIARACEDPTLTIETDDHTVHIRGDGSHFKVFGYDPKEYPPVRDFADATVDCEVAAGVLYSLITRTLFAAAVEHSRYAINGVLFERSNKRLRLVATDGRRLAMAKGECQAGEGERSCIVPSKALKLITKLVDDPDAPVRLALEENQILLAVGDPATPGEGAVVSSNLVEGAFPPFEDVVPREQDKKVSFDAATLGSAIKRAALLTNEESKGVRMSFADDKLTLTSRAPEMGEATVEVHLEDYKGDPLDIGFNPNFITDALNVVSADKVIVELKAPNKPGVLRTGNDFTYVLMPVNLQ